MTVTIDTVEEKLKNHNRVIDQIALLEYELLHPIILSSSELLSAFAFGKSKCDIPTKSSGGEFNRVAHLAIHYHEMAKKMSDDTNNAVFEEWKRLTEEVLRLEEYLGLLAEKYQKVLRAFYIDQKSWQMIEKETNLSRRTLVRRKTYGLELLLEMYRYANSFH